LLGNNKLTGFPNMIKQVGFADKYLFSA